MPPEPAPFSAHLGCLFENEIVGVVLVRDGVVAACNRCFARMLGRERSGDLEGAAFADLAPPGEGQDGVRSLVDPGQDAAGQVGEFYLLKNDATLVACRCSRARQCFALDQEARTVVLILQDVTEYQRLAEDYNKTLLDLEEAKLVQEENANVLSDMIVQLEIAEKAKLEKERMEGIVQLAIAASHELSQPLQAVQNDIFFLQEALPEGSEEQQALDAISVAVSDMGKIVAKFRKITSCKTTEYTTDVTMLDLDKSSAGEDPGPEG